MRNGGLIRWGEICSESVAGDMTAGAFLIPTGLVPFTPLLEPLDFAVMRVNSDRCKLLSWPFDAVQGDAPRVTGRGVFRSDLGQIRNGFGFKYFSMLHCACLVNWELVYTLHKCKPGSIAPGQFSWTRKSILIQNNCVFYQDLLPLTPTLPILPSHSQETGLGWVTSFLPLPLYAISQNLFTFPCFGASACLWLAPACAANQTTDWLAIVCSWFHLAKMKKAGGLCSVGEIFFLWRFTFWRRLFYFI